MKKLVEGDGSWGLLGVRARGKVLVCEVEPAVETRSRPAAPLTGSLKKVSPL